MRTTYIAKEADIVKKWYVIDAEGVTLGRLASEVASILRGKNKPQYAPNADMGDYVIIVNAEKVAVTGKKLEQKMYRHHSGWTGGLKETRLDKMLETHPERVIEHAVKVCFLRMLWAERCSASCMFTQRRTPSRSTETRNTGIQILIEGGKHNGSS